MDKDVVKNAMEIVWKYGKRKIKPASEKQMNIVDKKKPDLMDIAAKDMAFASAIISSKNNMELMEWIFWEIHTIRNSEGFIKLPGEERNTIQEAYEAIKKEWDKAKLEYLMS